MKKGDVITPQQAQDLALKAALNGRGFVSPNPLVGCVIVDRNHHFLSSGFHARLGGDHAEVDAVKKISESELNGATLYVTLEPCAHQGLTPSCAKMLAEKPIAKVVVALKDPNPLVAGKGIAMLEAKGIKVEIDHAFGENSARVCEQFLWHISNKLPFVALKIAASLDGQVALKSGESQWITSEKSRLAARRLRAGYDATLIGAGTLIRDNPRLDFRDTEFEGKKTNRVVIWDPKSKAQDFLTTSNLLKAIPKENITVVTSSTFGEPELRKLYDLKIYSLFVEGGAYVQSQLIQNSAFQKFYYFVAPTILGRGLGWSEHLHLETMAHKINTKITNIEKIDQDLLLTVYPV